MKARPSRHDAGLKPAAISRRINPTCVTCAAIRNVAQLPKRRRKVKLMGVNNRSAGPRYITEGR